MNIRIVTDSTCDLPAKTIKELNILVIPLFINIADRGYLDGVDISRKEFYTNLPKYSEHPTTGTPGPKAFSDAFKQLAAEGASEIISIHISEALSATVQVARKAAEEFDDLPVYVRDSAQLSSGTGFQVELAARMAQAGHSAEDILLALEELSTRTFLAAGLDTLEFLKRSGRMNGIITGIGTLLQLKPILTMKDGQPGSERVRTREKADKRLLEMLEPYQPIERIALLHSNAPKTAQVLREKIANDIGDADLFSLDITPVIGAHIGPGAVGFAVVRKKNQIRREEKWNTKKEDIG